MTIASSALPPPASGRPDEDPPAGFTPMVLTDPFEAFVGPIYERPCPEDGEGAPFEAAFRIDARHLNTGGSVHGGMLMTFADAVLGACAWRAMGRRPTVTLSMSCDFVRGAGSGTLVTCRPVLTRQTRAILFVRGALKAGGEPLMTVSSLWKVLGA